MTPALDIVVPGSLSVIPGSLSVIPAKAGIQGVRRGAPRESLTRH